MLLHCLRCRLWYAVVCISIALLCGFTSSIAQQPQFLLTASKTIVPLNANFEIVFTLHNANGENFEPPPLDDFEVLSGPNYNASVRLSDYRVIKETKYSYILKPRRKGTFTIGPARIEVNSTVLKSNTLVIVVTDPNANEKQLEQLFVQVIPHANRAFIGQQILLDYKLFTTISVDRYSLIEEPSYEGFYAEELHRFYSSPTTEDIDGHIYTTKILRRVALFPLQTGTFTISPAKFRFLTSESHGLFFNQKMKAVEMSTDSIVLTVDPLPPGAPAHFSGAVGNYSFEAIVDATASNIGKAITLQYIVIGNGDPKRIDVKSPILENSFDIFPGKITDEVLIEKSTVELIIKKSFEFQLVAEKEGKFHITPIFSFFDPVEQSYRTIQKSPIEIHILPGGPTHGPIDNIAKEDKALQLKAFKTEAKLRSLKNVQRFYRLAFILFIAPFAILFCIWLYTQFKNTFQAKSGNDAISLTEIDRKLDELLHLACDENREAEPRAVLNELKILLFQFFDEKNAYDHSRKSILIAMERANVPSEVVNRFFAILDESERILFGGSVIDRAQLCQMITDAKGVLAELKSLAPSS